MIAELKSSHQSELEIVQSRLASVQSALGIDFDVRYTLSRLEDATDVERLRVAQRERNEYELKYKTLLSENEEIRHALQFFEWLTRQS